MAKRSIAKLFFLFFLVYGGESPRQSEAFAAAYYNVALGFKNLNYPQRLPNSTFTGSSAGTPGNPGLFWDFQPGTGVNVAISATGTVGNLNYLDLSYSGTSIAAVESVGLTQSYSSIYSFIPTVNGTTWTASLYVKLTSGSIPAGGHLAFGFNVFDAGLGYVDTYASDIIPTGTLQRFNQTHTINDVGAAYIAPVFVMYIPPSTPTNATFRIAGYQLERASAVSPYDATTPHSIVLNAGTPSWTVPTGWPSGHNWITLIGAGGSGSARQSATVGGNGGGGGGFTQKANVNLTPGQVVPVSIPAGGSGSICSFNSGAVTAKSGANATTATAGAGGTAGTGGDVSFVGGAGFKTTSGAGGGGGGAAGPFGIGGSSTSQTGGTADNNAVGGGSGGNPGNSGVEIDGSAGAGSGAGGANSGNNNGLTGGNYGGGGSGSGTNAANTGGTGGPGAIVILYSTHIGVK